MSFDLLSSALFGQTDEVVRSPWWWTVLLLCLALPIPALLGQRLAAWLRMRDYGWRLAVIFCALASAGVIVATGRLNLGVDLKGGVILIYEIDREILPSDGGGTMNAGDIEWNRLIQQITNRINPSGTKEIVVRRYGEWQIEIIVPEVQDIEIERIKRLISTAGALEFRIVANRTDHEHIISRAQEQAQDPLNRRSRQIRDEGRQIGLWARVGRDAEPGPGGYRAFKVDVSTDIIRDPATGEILDPPPAALGSEAALQQWLESEDIKELDVLMATDDEFNVTGQHLGMVSRSWDETARPSVNFNMKGEGVGLMAGLTGSNLPDQDRGRYRLLGIILDNTLLSAPRVMSTISDRGRITGNFTQEEVDFLVGILQAGSLPAALKKAPISENKIGAVLGEMTIRKGRTAIGIALATVVLFILFWYRLAGIIACVALAANLLLILAFMILFKAALTLPGLAGLVLTIGMSVDANVLIYERIREERRRGAALRMAIRNGFDRATTTIVDANVTTLITGVVLYAIGTDQIRGFAITLILGILMSMFTAIFCARAVFEILERTRWLKDLKLRSLFADAHFDFMGKRRVCIAASIVLIAIGVVAIWGRGVQIFDIDFLGGTSVTMVVDKPTSETEIRRILDASFRGRTVEGSTVQYSVNRVDVAGQQPMTVWKIDSSIPEVEELEDILAGAFPVSTYSMVVGDLQETKEPLPGAVEATEPMLPPAVPATSPPTPEQGARRDLPPPSWLASADPADFLVALNNLAAEPAPAEPAPAEPAPAEPAPAEPAPAEPAPAEPAPAEPAPAEPAPAEPAPAEPAPAEPAPAEPAPAEPAPAEPAPAEPAPAEPAPAEPAPAEPAPAEPAPAEPAPAEAMPAEPAPAEATPPEPDPAASEASTLQPLAAEPAAAEKPAAQPPAEAATPGPSAPPSGKEAAPDAAPVQRILTTAELSFGQDINGRTLQDELLQSAQELGVQWSEEDVLLHPVPMPTDWTVDDSHGFTRWEVTLGAEQEVAGRVLTHLQEKLTGTPVWPSSNKIGGKVAGDTRSLAIAAMFTSLLGIIIYIWIRFQGVVYGLAAVVALIHDVLITLGAIALSYWLAGVLGFLQVQEFKISLTVVAAILTIVGYSLNDTIVIFDRIREVRGKSPLVTSDMLNISLNQTLSRTLLTSFTTWIVVVILYFLGGAGIHDFAFCLVVGIFVGTYSSIYIASPVLLWMSEPKPTRRVTQGVAR